MAPRPVSVMIVTLNLTTNTVECLDWAGQKIKPFCGEFTYQRWAHIKRFCNLSEDFPFTRIYIWAGMQQKHLAYSEPIHNYIKNPAFLLTGQGYHFGSGKTLLRPV